MLTFLVKICFQCKCVCQHETFIWLGNVCRIGFDENVDKCKELWASTATEVYNYIVYCILHVDYIIYIYITVYLFTITYLQLSAIYLMYEYIFIVKW